MVDRCTSLLNKTGESANIPLCAAENLPTTDCTAFPFDDVVPADFKCPAPLIQNPTGLPNENCVGICCIPCSPGPNFYAPGSFHSIETVSVIKLMFHDRLVV